MFRLEPIKYIFENTTVWLTPTSISEKMNPEYVDQGITIQNGISIGMYSAGSPNQFAQTASISQSGDITTQGTITCQGDFFAQNIFTTKLRLIILPAPGKLQLLQRPHSTLTT